MKKSFIFFVTLLVLAACNNPVKKNFIGISGIDSTIKPGNNFFRYVNGIWYDTVKIPPSQAGVGTYMFMNYPQRLRLQGILDSVSRSNNPEESIEQKVGDFYSSGMDTATINRRGFEPLKPIFENIQAIKNIPSLMKYVAGEEKLQNTSIIGFYTGPDNKNSNINIAQFYQAGIGLPDRDYYFKTDSQSVVVQNAYRNYIATLFRLTGSDAATAVKNAGLVYDMEKQIAVSHRTNVELRDVTANYNKMSVANLDKKEPDIGWQILLNNLGVKVDSVDVSQPAYYMKLNELLKSTPIAAWKVYLTASSLRRYAEILGKPFTDAAFAYTKILDGQAVQKSRGEIMANAVDNELGQALGQLYVKKYFPESAKKRALELVNNIQKALAARIDNLNWMSDSTKQKAKDKLFAITKKIGYPDKWRDYSHVKIVRNKYFENTVSADSNEYQYDLAKLGKPVDRTEWYTTPSTVTAYNNPSANEIVFPAGILQFPYFDNNADDAINYGGIGMVIGHEMTHTFDDQGAQFDKYGNVKNWWTKEDYKKFKANTQKVIDEYNTFTVLDSLHINGSLTVGENTADIGGLAIAYAAFKMTKEGQDTSKINGYTPDQRFFLSFARIWRVKMTDKFLRLWINTNPHSPPIWRVNGPLMNFTPFYNAFNVKPGDSMYLPLNNRLKIW